MTPVSYVLHTSSACMLSKKLGNYSSSDSAPDSGANTPSEHSSGFLQLCHFALILFLHLCRLFLQLLADFDVHLCHFVPILLT